MNATRRRLLALQKKVYRVLKDEIEERLGTPPASIRRYEREALRDFRPSRENKARAVAKSSFVKAIQSAQVVFIGDFHTFSQAPKTAIRLMRESGAVGPMAALGLELISSDQQDALDAFQDGSLDLEEFHARIAYAESWGFPWKNYAPLFEWAAENGVRLIALNRPRGSRRSAPNSSTRVGGPSPPSTPGLAELRERDRWAAQIIAEKLAAMGADARIFVLYGDLHVGEAHLPRELERETAARLGRPDATAIKWMTVHQHRDAAYWRLAEQGREIETEILKYSSRCYCLFSGTPWARLQSLVNWLEAGTDDSSSDSDYLSLMRAYGQAIAELLRIPAPSFESLSLSTMEDGDLLAKLDNDQFSARERQLIQFQISLHGCAYVPRADLAYLASPSHNRAAELAAVHLLRRTTGLRQIFTGERDDFFRLILEAAFGFLGSLVLNPRRKCDFIGDHRERLGALEAGARAEFPGELEARRLTIKVLKRRRVRGRHPVPEHFAQFSAARAGWVAAQWVGQILGKRLHRAMLRHSVGTSRVIEVFLTPLEPGETFENRFLLLRGQAAAAPLEISKTAHI